MKKRILFALIILALTAAALSNRHTRNTLFWSLGLSDHRADVVVFGATPAGVLAAVAAARNGSSVILLEPRDNLGGMMSNGLSGTDLKTARGVGGLSLEFFQRVGKKYRSDQPHWRFEPRVAEAVFREMLEETGVEIFLGTRLRGVGVWNKDIKFLSVRLAGVVDAAVFIDASYEGDLLAAAGASYAIGRESRSDFDESFAGVVDTETRFQFDVPLSAYDEQGLLPFIEKNPPGKPGSGDHKIMAYNYRLCLTQQPGYRVPIPQPNSYDPRWYELLARYLEDKPRFRFIDVITGLNIPRNKFDINTRGPVSTNFVGQSWEYPEASFERRL